MRVKNLLERLRGIESSREECERASRLNNVILYGIPPSDMYKREIPADLINKLEKAFKIKLGGKFVTCYRLRPNSPRGEDNSAPVLVKFQHPLDKKEFVDLVHSRVWTADIFGGSPNIRIFINEHLTPHRAILFREANTLQQRGKIQAWISDGRVFVSKNKTCGGIELLNLGMLRELTDDVKPSKKQFSHPRYNRITFPAETTPSSSNQSETSHSSANSSIHDGPSSLSTVHSSTNHSDGSQSEAHSSTHHGQSSPSTVHSSSNHGHIDHSSNQSSTNHSHSSHSEAHSSILHTTHSTAHLSTDHSHSSSIDQTHRTNHQDYSHSNVSQPHPSTNHSQPATSQVNLLS